ncbi:MAG TPA: hypothetical protein VGD67_20050 [Pseudonocardiaceae bacterium]
MTPVPLGSPEETTAELLAVLRRVKGRDAARDPALEIAATDAAELAHRQRAGLLAVVEHPDADPAVLMAWMTPLDRALDPGSAVGLGRHLADSGGPDIREVTRTTTAAGHPAVIVERITITGAQLQVVVVDERRPRVAVFTLHSPTGRGWLDVAALTGRFVGGLDLTADGSAPGTRGASRRPLSGTSGRSAPR